MGSMFVRFMPGTLMLEDPMLDELMLESILSPTKSPQDARWSVKVYKSTRESVCVVLFDADSRFRCFRSPIIDWNANSQSALATLSRRHTFCKCRSIGHMRRLYVCTIEL